MTVLDDRQLTDRPGASARQVGIGSRDASHSRSHPLSHPRSHHCAPYRPSPARPAVAPLRYRGTAVRVSRAAHGRRPVSTASSVALAALSALITLWLGFLGHFSGDRAAAPVSDQLAVVQVQPGETLQQLAARIAPSSPAMQVAERIRELNKLDSSSVDAGQTLIAPVG